MVIDKVLVKEICQAGITDAVAEAAILPGMLIERTSTGGVRPHTTLNGPALGLIALEKEGGSLSDHYLKGETVRMKITHKGDQIYGILGTGSVQAGGYLLSKGKWRFCRLV